MALIVSSKGVISDNKKLDDLLKRAEEIKKEHMALKREAAKDKSASMVARLANKEEQLRRVASAVRAARAEAHSNASLVVDAAPARLDIEVLMGTTGQPMVQMRGRGDLVTAMINLLKKDLKGKATGTSSMGGGGMLMTFKDIKLPELSTKAEDAKERVLNDLGDGVLSDVSGNPYRVGDVLRVDWDGPSRVKVVDVEGKTVRIVRIDASGKERKGEENSLIVKASELQRMSDSVSVVSDSYDKSTTAKITVGRDTWYVTKIDSTHAEFVNDPKYVGIGGMGVSHIGQHRRDPYYEDLRSWLKGGKSPDGKTYSENDSLVVSQKEEVSDGGVSNKAAAWFTGTVLYNIKHPTQGTHQLTPEQIKTAPAEYKNKLYKNIQKAIDNGDIDEGDLSKHDSVSDSVVEVEVSLKYARRAQDVVKDTKVKAKVTSTNSWSFPNREKAEEFIEVLTEQGIPEDELEINDSESGRLGSYVHALLGDASSIYEISTHKDAEYAKGDKVLYKGKKVVIQYIQGKDGVVVKDKNGSPVYMVGATEKGSGQAASESELKLVNEDSESGRLGSMLDSFQMNGYTYNVGSVITVDYGGLDDVKVTKIVGRYIEVVRLDKNGKVMRGKEALTMKVNELEAMVNTRYRGDTEGRTYSGQVGPHKKGGFVVKKKKKVNDDFSLEDLDAIETLEELQELAVSMGLEVSEETELDLREEIRSQLSETGITDAAPDRVLKNYDGEVNWGTEKKMPFSQGYAINKVIKQYKIPATEWGYGVSGRYALIGVGTKKQKMFWLDKGTELVFQGILNKDGSIADSNNFPPKIKESFGRDLWNFVKSRNKDLDSSQEKTVQKWAVSYLDVLTKNKGKGVVDKGLKEIAKITDLTNGQLVNIIETLYMEYTAEEEDSFTRVISGSAFMDASGYGDLSVDEAALIVDIEEDASFLRRNIKEAKSLEKKGYITIGQEGTAVYEAELTKRGVQWLKDYNSGKFDATNFGVHGGISVTVEDDKSVILSKDGGTIRVTNKKWAQKLHESLGKAITKM